MFHADEFNTGVVRPDCVEIVINACVRLVIQPLLRLGIPLKSVHGVKQNQSLRLYKPFVLVLF